MERCESWNRTVFQEHWSQRGRESTWEMPSTMQKASEASSENELVNSASF